MQSGPTWILGLSASHNGAACLLRGDEIVVAIQEERLTRRKRQRLCGAESTAAARYCLNYAGITPDDLKLVAITVTGPATDPLQDVTRNPLLQATQNRIPTLVVPHHFAHAVSAFATSGFREAAVLVSDGVGSPLDDQFEEEQRAVTGPAKSGWEIISLYWAVGTKLLPLEKHLAEDGAWLIKNQAGMYSFGSLGGMFSAIADQLFGDAMEAGKVMGLAPFGSLEFSADHFFDLADGGFRFANELPLRFRHRERWPAHEQEYKNLACSVQVALERALLYLTSRLRELCGADALCCAGGVALNSVANERIIRESGFKKVFITPAAEDSGAAIGAAYYALWQVTKENSFRPIAHDSYGRPYSSREIAEAVNGARSVRAIKSADVIADTVDLLCDGKIVGWFHGGSELGPRSLGQRSILCDSRCISQKEKLNRKIKKREPFRPFAPSILLEEAPQWFETGGASAESPFMLRVCDFKRDKRERVPAVVHVDGTGRLQTLTKKHNGRFYELVRRFHEKTGVPLVLNTSFNVAGEPIVETPADAIACLANTELDCCVFEDRIIFKYLNW